MAKQLNINLNVKADTQQAQQALNALGKSLHDIQNIKNMPMVADESYKSAANAAKELERNLQSAVNVDTGKLDLNKFSMSLKRSNTSITELAVKLNGAGAVGQQAFLNLAKSIALADNSALNLGTRLSGLMTTLKNTVRWQISSSVLHGFMGAIQGAYGYAQDLNKSLNNIRIVTGQNIDQMARFAEEANKAAKALSTSTTAYTDAALIYYQQGLDDKAVKERTDVTIKLSNVSRQSAEEVSSQMTAIWNNFDDGTKSLEYYADVITKLGAATAASSSEISDGLQKFAAVADTVGLSYEKATAALATVVAETRQSADTVGTAFKTMFARFQGLKLGETLEDGVGLNKYSAALNTVGVNILTANGELKDMDSILDELGAKWNTISNAQQVALAETVAGTRQYAQFMAIMENYDKILANQALGAGAEGTLQEQADIYAEGWEAASKRVRAAAQGIYQDLINDKFFITVLNGFEKFLTGVNNVIDGLGGLKGMLLLIGSIFMQHYAKEMPRVLSAISQNLMIITGQGEKVKSTMLTKIAAGLELNKNTNINMSQASYSNEMQAKYESTQKAVEMTQKLNAAMRTLSESEIAEYQAKISQTVQEGEYLAELGKELDTLEKLNTEQSAATARSAIASYGEARTTKGFSDDEVSGATYEEAINEQLAEQQRLRTEIRQIQDDIDAGILDESEGLNLIKTRNDEIVASKERVTALQASEKSVLDFLNGSYKTAVSNVRILEDETDKITKRADNWEAAQEKIKTLLAGSTQEQKAGVKLTEDLAKQMQKYASYLQQTLEATNGGILPDGAAKELEKFKAAITQAQETGNWDDVFAKLRSGGDVFSFLSAQVETAKGALSDTRHEGEQLGIIFENNPAVEKMTQDMGQAAVTAHQLTDGLNGLGAEMDKGLNHTTSMSEGLVKIGSAAMQVSMAINGIKRISEIWNNEDLSTGEKVLQTITSLSMILPVIANMTKVQTALNGLLAKSAISVKLTLGEVYLIIGAIIAVGVLFVKIFEAIEKSSPEGKFKAIQKAAEELSKATDEAKQKADDLKSSFDQYDSVIEKLKQCTKGTQEWQEAMKEVQAITLDLIQKYPELLSKMEFEYRDGVRIVTNFDEIVEEAKAKSENLQLRSIMLNAEAAKAKAEIDSDPKYNQQRADARQQLLTASSIGVDQILKSNKANEIIESSGLNAFSDLINGIFTEEHAIDFQKKQQAIEDNLYNLRKQDVYARYAEINEGYEYIGGNKFKVTDDKGNTKKVKANKLGGKERIYSEVATQTATDELWEKYFKNQYNSLIQNVSKYSSAFSDKNFDIVKNLITGQLGDIDPEDFKNMQLMPEEKQAFGNLLRRFLGVDDVDAYIKENYNLNAVYRAGIKDTKDIQESVKDLNKTFGSLKIGDTVENLDGLSEEMQSYFTMMEDGTFRLTKSAEQFQDALFREKVKDYEDILERFANLGVTQGLNAGVIQAAGMGNQDAQQRIQDYNQMQGNAIAYAATAETLDQLNYVKQEFNKYSIDSITQALAEDNALQNLASQYESCSDELENFQFALTTQNESLKENAKIALKNSIYTAEMSKKMDLSADDVEDQARAFVKADNSLDKYIDSEKEQFKIATKMAILNQSMNKGITTLSKNWENWKKILDSADATSLDYINTIQEMRSVLKDLVGVVDEDFIPKDFFDAPEILDLMGQAAKGDIVAINTLGTELAKSTITKDFQKIWESLQNTPGVALDRAAEVLSRYQNTLLDGIDTITQKIQDGTAESAEDLNQLLDGSATSWVEALNEMAKQTGMSVDEMNSLLNELGLDAEVVTGSQMMEAQVPEYQTIEKVNGPLSLATGAKVTESFTRVIRYRKIQQAVPFAQINVNDNQGETPDVRYVGRYTPSESSLTTDGSGSGGGKSAKHSVTTSTPEDNRYTRVENTVNTLSKQYDRLGESRDRAWGLDKLNIMDSEVDKMKELGKAYEDYLEEVAGTDWQKLHKKIQEGVALTPEDIAAAGGYLKKDYEALIKGSGVLEYAKEKDAEGNEIIDTFRTGSLKNLLKDYGGLDLELGANGKIVNKDELLAGIAAYEAAQNKWWNESDQEDVENKARRTRIEMLIDYFKDAIDQYDETVDKLIEESDNWQENFYKIQEQIFDNLNESLELQLDLSNRANKRLEYAAKILGNNFFKTAEVMNTLYTPSGQSQYATFVNDAESYKAFFEEAKANTEISQADLIEAAKTAQDGIYGVIDSILDMNSQMREYYSNTLDGAVEELSKLTDQMDHQVEVMDHLKNVLSLLNRETDYKSLDTLIRGTAQMRKNRLDTSTQTYEMLREQQLFAEIQYQQYLNDNLIDAAEEYKTAVLDPIVSKTAEAENQMFEDAQSYLEAINELFTNTINDIMDKQEKMLTDGLGWDFLTNTMNRASSIQDEYLTKTNQIYETNALLRKLSQDMDKTDNVAAKTKLKNFSSEIEAMQQQEVLSQNDLDIAKARYEVLLAEIALTEAQNAKSTVRLQRDSEGNYGYVYTADQDKVADAEQNLADKRNDLYNLVLDQTNEYGQKIINLEKERDEALMELAEEYRGAEGEKYEEYLRKREQLTKQYNDLLYAAYDSYDKGIMWLNRTASTDYREAWVTEYDTVIEKGRDYEAQTKDAMNNIENAMKEYEDNAKVVMDNVYTNVDTVDRKTRDLVDANNLLKDSYDRLLPAVETEISDVKRATEQWANHYEQILDNIKGLKEYSDILNDFMNSHVYRKDVDISQEMIELLKSNGNNINDPVYKALAQERDYKLDGQGLSGGMYTKGENFNKMIHYYVANGLTGVIYDAVVKDLASKNIELEKWLKEATSFDTGGYTGSGGSFGKLAVLHDKELVLNAVDTDNLLKTVSIVRQLNSAIDLRAAASGLSSGLNSPFYQAGAQTIEQEVTIRAEFPNAINHIEIEEAFNSLINRAAQFANRT